MPGALKRILWKRYKTRSISCFFYNKPPDFSCIIGGFMLYITLYICAQISFSSGTRKEYAESMIRWAGKQEGLNYSYWKRMWELVYPWLIYEGIMMLVTFVFGLSLLVFKPALFEGTEGVYKISFILNQQMASHYALLALIICLLTIPLLLFIWKRDRKIEERESFQMEAWQKPGLLSFLLCFCLGLSACIILNHVLIYSGLYELLAQGFEETAQTLYQGKLLPELLSIGILTPIVEELIFRGLIYRRIRWYLNALPAMVFSALLFAVFHGNLLQGIYAFALGFLMAFVYERTHSILAPVCIHVGANLISVLMTDIPSFGRIYETQNEGAFLLFTAGMMLVFTAAFYFFYTRVQPARLDGELSVAPRQQENKEDDYGTRTI